MARCSLSQCRVNAESMPSLANPCGCWNAAEALTRCHAGGRVCSSGLENLIKILEGIEAEITPDKIPVRRPAPAQPRHWCV